MGEVKTGCCWFVGVRVRCGVRCRGEEGVGCGSVDCSGVLKTGCMERILKCNSIV